MQSESKRSKHTLWLILACAILVLILIGIFPTRVEQTQDSSGNATPPTVESTDRDR